MIQPFLFIKHFTNLEDSARLLKTFNHTEFIQKGWQGVSLKKTGNLHLFFRSGSHPKDNDLLSFMVYFFGKDLLFPAHPFSLVKDEQVNFPGSTQVCIPGNLFNSFANNRFPGSPYYLTFHDKTLY
ncbi:MAG: hypothetical protein BWY45_03303 [Euryarchaeota archaeon ADurb.Bin294]|nr:MAG: hypothetical protein BWY45_03303 [Euryarchaeota archaeon ADurb.Bin294]